MTNRQIVEMAEMLFMSEKCGAISHCFNMAQEFAAEVTSRGLHEEVDGAREQASKTDLIYQSMSKRQKDELFEWVYSVVYESPKGGFDITYGMSIAEGFVDAGRFDEIRGSGFFRVMLVPQMPAWLWDEYREWAKKPRFINPQVVPSVIQ